MLRIGILFLVFNFFSFEIHATHLMGGSLTYRSLGQVTSELWRYEVTAKIYIDCENGLAPLREQIFIGVYKQNAASPNAPKVKYDIYSIIKSDSAFITLPGQGSGCTFDPGVCVLEGTYTTEILLPFNGGGYHLISEDCCRNGSEIVNLINPGDQGMSYYAFIPPNYISNNSPVFVEAPVPYFCRNDTASFINTVQDVDGDVLIYSFSAPNQGLSIVNNDVLIDPYPFPIDPVEYITNYSNDAPFGPGGYSSINASTGLTNYLSPNEGAFVVCVEIREYRNNNLIGITRRDIQLIVRDCPVNSPPVLANDTVTDTRKTIYDIKIGEQLCFNIRYDDFAGDSLYFSATGIILDSSLTNPSATLSDASGDAVVNSEFCWTPSCSQMGTYLFFVKVRDNGCPVKLVSEVFTINVLSESIPVITGPSVSCANEVKTYSVPVFTGSIYYWSVSGGSIIGSDSSASVNITWGSTPSGIVSVYEMKATGCTTLTATKNVSISSSPLVDPGSEKNICQGDSVQLGKDPVSGNSYSWSPVTGLTNPGISNPVASPANSTTYTLTVVNTVGCSGDSTVMVNINDSVIATFLKDTMLCKGDSITIGVPSSSGISYTWSPGNYLSDSLASNPVAFPIQSTVFKLTMIIDSSGCSSLDDLLITVNDNPTLDIGNDTIICLGESIIIGEDSASGYNYLWSAGNNISNVFLSMVDVVADTSGIYSLTKTGNGTGCTVSDSLFIQTNTPLGYAVSPGWLCPGDSVRLQAYNGVDYLWQPSLGLSDSLIADPMASPPSDQEYVVSIIDSNNCSVNDTILLAVNSIIPFFGGSDKSICTGDSIQIGDSVLSNQGTSFQWSPGILLSDSTIFNPYAFPDSTQDFVVKLSNDTCISFDTVSVIVNALPPVNAPGDTTICSGNIVVLSGSGASGYVWSSEGVNLSASPVLSINPDDSVRIILTGTDANGCINSDSLTINVNPLPGLNLIEDTSVCQEIQFDLGEINDTLFQYKWSSNNGFTSGLSKITISSVQSDVYYLLKKHKINECETSDTVSVTINSLPSASVIADTAVCKGMEIFIGDSFVSGNTYQWTSDPPGFTSDTSNPLLIALVPGTFILEEKIIATGCKRSDSLLITIKDPPLVNAGNDSVICKGESVKIGTISDLKYKYTWSSVPSGIFGFSDSIIINPINSASYIISVMDSLNGCVTMDSIFIQINLTPLYLLSDTVSACKNSIVPVGIQDSVGHSYLWTSFPSGFSSVQSINNVKADSGMFFILRDEIDTSGCFIVDSIFLKVNPLPVSNAAPDTSVCRGTLIFLGSPGAPVYNYIWESMPEGFNSQVASPYVSIITDSVFTVQIMDSLTNCFIRDSIEVKSIPLPLAITSPEQSLCSGLSVQAGVTAISGHLYQWTDGFGNIISTGSEISLIPDTSIRYYLTETDTVTGCFKTDSFFVEVKPIPPIPVLWTNAPVCEGNSLVLELDTGSGIFMQWPGGGIVTGSGIVYIDENCSLNSEGIHKSWAVVNGCSSDTFNLFVDIHKLPKVFTSNDSLICFGVDSIQLNGYVNGESNSMKWIWNGTGILKPSDTIVNPWYYFTSQDSGKGFVDFFLVSSDPKTCPPDTGDFTIRFGYKPIADAGEDLWICPEIENIQLDGKISGGSGYSIWIAGGLGTFNGTDSILQAIYEVSSNDTVPGKIMFILKTINSCADTSDTIFINRFDYAKAEMVLLPDMPNVGQPVQFNDVSDNRIVTSWLLDYQIMNYHPTFIHTYKMPGDHPVKLKIKDINGCVDSIEKILYVGPALASIPDIFTPNGDLMNDILYVRGGPFTEFEFRIFNEWGMEVFRSESQSIGWDGTFKGGNAQSSTYIYIFRGKTIEENDIQINGEVNLLR